MRHAQPRRGVKVGIIGLQDGGQQWLRVCLRVLHLWLPTVATMRAMVSHHVPSVVPRAVGHALKLQLMRSLEQPNSRQI